MNKESPSISSESSETDLDTDIDNELMNVVGGEHQSVRREKFDLSSTRIVLEKLLREGLVKPDDKLSDVMMVVEEEFKRIEDI